MYRQFHSTFQIVYEISFNHQFSIFKFCYNGQLEDFKYLKNQQMEIQDLCLNSMFIQLLIQIIKEDFSQKYS